MTSLFGDLPPRDALELERLTRLNYELREHREAILRTYGVADETELLEQLTNGNVPEHPGYEHYLAARSLADTRESVRGELARRLTETSRR